MKPIEILLIEDNPGDVELTKESLRNGKIKNNLKVIMDGEEALNFLFRELDDVDEMLPDIILLDLNLPKVSGREILKALKEDELRCSVPVIVLSSSEAASDIKSSYQLHANCFITKPVMLNDFLNVIKTIESFWVEIVKLPEKGR
ncbi:response regulator [Aliikangiella sp. IMCC44359]|uniref:response regulator n=1 Tax=Aliikangiella sp. IMCC44359 TaxID=3459125 RepID=UPI00403AAEBE